MRSELLIEAERRYLLDPVFHARAYAVVQVIEADLQGRTGCRLDQSDRGASLLAACVALVISERSPGFLVGGV